MTSDNDQRCSHCRHLNSANVLVCSLCGWALAKEGMELTYYPREEENNKHMLASHQLFSQQQTLLLGATVSPDCHKTNSDKNDGMAHFKINEVLGQGGMGAVYRAQDLTLHRFVALKLFRTQMSNTCGNGRQLLDEARLACKLNHPNIVTIYDIARGQDCNFIVMEWVDGQSLDQLIPENGMAIEKALEYLTQIIDGLACAHQNGIIHRDIKPLNIMLNKENRIKILDFGIADLLSRQEQPPAPSDNSQINAPNPTRFSGIVGTPHYMAPEQIFGQLVDQRADIFALGILFYEMLTGKRPFSGNNLFELKDALSTGDYQPINQLRPNIPASLIVLIEKMLAVDISQRWQTSKALAKEIHGIYKDLTERKNWWQRRHWSSKAAVILSFIFVLGWNLKEVIFPPTIDELVERQLAEATKIAILPFENISGDPLLQIFNDGLVAMLSNDLDEAGREQGDGTTWIIPASEIGRMKEPTVQKVNDSFGVDLVLTGSVQHMGSTRSVVLNLLNGKNGRLLKSSELSILAEELFKGQSVIRQEVIKLLGWATSASIIQKFNAQSPQFDGAYKKYIEGKGYLYRFDQAGNLDRALLAFKQALEIDTKYQNAYESLAETQLRYYRNSKDGLWLERMKQTVNELMKINPANEQVEYLMAELMTQKGAYEDAIKHYKKSIDKKPKQIKPLIGLAIAYGKTGNAKDAEAVYKSAMELSPNNWNLLAEFGVFYFHNGLYKKALEQFTQLTIISPNNDYGFQNVAAVYYSMGDIKKAIVFTKQAISLTPSADAFANLGTMYFYLKKYREAIIAYEKAIELNNDSYMIWGNLADAYKLDGNKKSHFAYQNAVLHTRHLLAINPNDDIAKSHIAYYLANLQQNKQAMEYAQQIGQQHSGWENFVVATAYDRLGLIEQTLTHLTIALDKSYPIDEVKITPLLKRSRLDKRFQLLIQKYNNSGD